MKVQIRIEVFFEELLYGFRMARRDMPVAHVLADHRSILGLHQPVVVGVPRSRFGLLHQQLVEQAGHRVIDKFAAVI